MLSRPTATLAIASTLEFSFARMYYNLETNSCVISIGQATPLLPLHVELLIDSQRGLVSVREVLDLCPCSAAAHAPTPAVAVAEGIATHLQGKAAHEESCRCIFHRTCYFRSPER